MSKLINCKQCDLAFILAINMKTHSGDSGFGKSHEHLEKLQNRQCNWGWIWGWYGTHLKIDGNIGTNVIDSTFQKVVNPTK